MATQSIAAKDFRHVRKTTVVKKPNGGRIKVGSYRPDKKHPDDKTYQSSQFSADNLPPKIDLRPYMTAVEDQGDSNSCTANAMAGAYEYLGKRLNNQETNVSRLFIYYNARNLDGATDQDEGTYLRSCIKVLKKYGACSEETWPFDLDYVYTSPEEEAYHEASSFLVEDAYRVEVDLDQMRSCLAEGYPFTFGLELFASFQSAGANGLIPMPDPENDRHDGGHAMLCVGYSDPDKVFIVRNSWGDDWGDRGYCYIPYDYMTNADLNGDLWSIRRVTEGTVDLSEGVQGGSSLFGVATAIVARALQEPGASRHLEGYENEYVVEYEAQSVYVEGQGEVAVEDCDDLESLYYQTYEDEYEEYTFSEDAEVDEESEDSESEDFEETEDSYEESEDSLEDEDSEETEDSYDEDVSDNEEEETEDSYDEDEESIEGEDEDSESIEDSYDEDDADDEEESIEDEASEEIEDGYDEECEDYDEEA